MSCLTMCRTSSAFFSFWTIVFRETLWHIPFFFLFLPFCRFAFFLVFSFLFSFPSEVKFTCWSVDSTSKVEFCISLCSGWSYWSSRDFVQTDESDGAMRKATNASLYSRYKCIPKLVRAWTKECYLFISVSKDIPEKERRCKERKEMKEKEREAKGWKGTKGRERRERKEWKTGKTRKQGKGS